ncbi:MAG: sugar ABC transporter permease [Acholeplasmatales bacterium]|nr:sugar ABC transporter permease [Acholeplasmatales bacterium]
MEALYENRAPKIAPRHSKGWYLRRTIMKSTSGWLFVLPAVILMVFFTFYPIVNSVISAFMNNYEALDNSYRLSIGFENFAKVINNKTGVPAQFLVCLDNTLFFAFVSVPISTILALLIAVALNSIKALQKAYQTVLFLPYLTNAIAMGAVFLTFFHIVGARRNIETYGLANNFLGWFGLAPIEWDGIGNTWGNRFIVIIYEIWAGLPFKILILFSALQNVNKQYYDAAKVDGASKFTTLWRITVPLISPMLSYLLITGLMGGLKAYSAIVGIFGQNMGPAGSYEMGTMVGYIYACIEKGQTGYAAAGSLILFAIIMVFTGINMYISKKKVHY